MAQNYGPPPTYYSGTRQEGNTGLQNGAPPPYHDWTSIPDNSLLPPPPALSYKISSGANATEEEADRGEEWCGRNKLWQPIMLRSYQREAVKAGALKLFKIPGSPYVGDVLPEIKNKPGSFRCRTTACPDSILLTDLPLYSAIHDSPLQTQVPKTIYFEVHVEHIGRNERKKTHASSSQWQDEKRSSLKKFFSTRRSSPGASEKQEVDSGIAIGFCAPPYPLFRLPGWHRGSLAVHSDDGHKYVNNTEGGSAFTTPFQDAQAIGIGMTFSLPSKPPTYEGAAQNSLDIEVFFMKDGERVGGWDGNAELDAVSAEGTVGLKGECDLMAAIGIFGDVDVKVKFDPSEWLYRPPQS